MTILEVSPPSRRVNCRPGLGVLLLLAITARSVARLPSGHHTEPKIHVWDYRSIKGNWKIGYGFKNNELLFVIFVGDSKHEPVSEGISEDSSNNFTGVLRRADGTEIPLDGRKQLFECVDGIDQESDERVTLEEFKSYLSSNPETYCIDALLKYSKAHR